MYIEFICFLNFDSSTCHSRDIQLLVTEICLFWSHFLYSKTGINKLSGSPQWHITFDLEQVALKCQKPLAGEKLSFFSNVFQILQNYWLPWKLSKM